MAATTTIEWTDRTWNPVVGCSLVSPGCTNCYAMRMAGRIEAMGTAPHYAWLTMPSKAGPVWTGAVRAAPDHVLTEPLNWRKPARIFVNSMSDLFHEAVPDEVIDKVFAVMALAPRHTFQVLTKRAERMRAYVTAVVQDRVRYSKWAARGAGIARSVSAGASVPPAWPLPNVWLGVSVEDQARADERIPILLDTPAAVRWISAEPLLGPVDLTFLPQPNQGAGPWWIDALNKARAGWYASETEPMDEPGDFDFIPRLDWVVAGGESGPGARPMHPDWVRSLRDQCAAAEVPFLFKQWGEWAPSSEEEAFGNPRSGWRCLAGHPHVAKRHELYPENGAAFIERKGKRAAGRLLDGVLHDAYPAARP